MATGIVDSMFGIKSPEEYQQDYLSGMLVAPSQMGNQSLYQQLVSTMANAGTMLGYGGGRLLGGRTSGEVEAAAVNNVLKTVSEQGYTNESDKFRAAALLFQEQGMGKQAEQAMVKYREALKEERGEVDRQRTLAQGKTRNIYKLVNKPIIDTFGEVVGYQQVNVQVTQEWDEKEGKWVDIAGGDAEEPTPTTPAKPTQAPQPKPSEPTPTPQSKKGRVENPDAKKWAGENKDKVRAADIPDGMSYSNDGLGGPSMAMPGYGNTNKADAFVKSKKFPKEVVKSNRWVLQELIKEGKKKGLSEQEVLDAIDRM